LKVEAARSSRQASATRTIARTAFARSPLIRSAPRAFSGPALVRRTHTSSRARGWDPFLARVPFRTTFPAPRRLFQQKHRRIHVRVGRFRASFILRCRRGLGSSAAVQPLSGDWTLKETGAGGDCPPDIASAVKTPTVMRIAQTGSLLSACLNVDGSVDWSSAAAAQGIVSESGLLLTAGNCCYADVPHRAVETYSLTFSSMSSPSGDTIQTSEESQVQPADPLVGGLTCTKTAEVTITRVLTAVACNADADCLNADHCGRCMQGRCRRSPLCQ